MAMTRWTSLLRSEIRSHPGHEALYSALRRAAFTGDGQSKMGSLLFVNAGLDVAKPLANQGDSFCGARRTGRTSTARITSFRKSSAGLIRTMAARR